MKEFKIQMYRGDTKKLIVNLNIDGEDVALNGYTVSLVNRVDKSVIAKATLSGKDAIFNFTKEISAELPIGTVPVMLVYTSTNHHVQQPGIFTVIEGVI